VYERMIERVARKELDGYDPLAVLFVEVQDAIEKVEKARRRIEDKMRGLDRDVLRIVDQQVLRRLNKAVSELEQAERYLKGLL